VNASTRARAGLLGFRELVDRRLVAFGRSATNATDAAK